MTKLLILLHDLVWGPPALALILGTGLYLTLATGFAQVRFFGHAWKQLLSPADREGLSPRQALSVALGATVGTGNLVGVAGAICLGGPGAVFWMWVSGFLGMATKYAEVTLALRYRGKSQGGPMYMIRQGLGKSWQWMAGLYSFLGLTAAFGVGNLTQVNSVVSAVNAAAAPWGCRETTLRNLAMGLILAVLVGLTLMGGAKRIGRAAEKLVPLAAAAYGILCLGALASRWQRIPQAVNMILVGAFSPGAVTGGLLGGMLQALRVGCARGVFTNEAGMGTASMAHALAHADHPAQQGILGILEVFLDTMVICTLTALVILTAGVPIPYGEDRGGALTAAAFGAVWGDWAGVAIAVFLSCFAFCTILGWGLYGSCCARFLLGPCPWLPLVQSLTVVPGAVLGTGTVWLLAETVNGLMTLPCLITLVLLRAELVSLTNEYKGKTAKGGNYADFHQRQSLRTVPHAKIPPLCHGGRGSGKAHLPSEHRPAGS